MSLLEITIFTTHRVILLVNGNGAKTIASSIHTPDIFYSPEAERNARPDFPALIKTDRSFPIPLFLHFHPTSLQGSNWPAVCSENVCGKTEPARRKPIVRQTERYHRIPRWAVRPSRMAGNISWYPSNTDELVYYEQTTMFPVKMASRGFIIPASPRLTTFHSTVYAHLIIPTNSIGSRGLEMFGWIVPWRCSASTIGWDTDDIVRIVIHWSSIESKKNLIFR